jgi:hypothetical protein
MSELTSKSLSICPHRFDGRRELCSLCAELPPSKKLDLLPCPFCGSSRIEIHEEFGGSSCSKCGALGPTRGPKDMLQRWNQRYSADEPPAGQYCEHGVRSDLRCFSCNPASSQPPSERQEHLTRTLAWVSTHEGVSKHVREIVSLALYGDVPTPPPPADHPLVKLFIDWWMDDLDNAEFFNVAMRECPDLARRWNALNQGPTATKRSDDAHQA